MADGTPGVVLRTAPVRDADLIVTLFTEAHGRVSAVARGARGSRRRFAGTLSMFVLARYELGRKPRGDLWSLENAEVEREWTQLASDVVAVAHASYLAELLGAIMPAEVPDPHVLDLTCALWDSLAAAGPSPAAMRALELAVLDLGGQPPSLDRCAVCDADDLDEPGTMFDPARGGAICRRCAAKSWGPGVRPLEPATRAYLRAIAATQLDLPAARAFDTDPRFTGPDRTAAREALVAMVVGLVGRPLRSLEYIAKLGAAGRKPT